MAITLLCACATKKEIRYIGERQNQYEVKIQHDTIAQEIHDSIFHTIYKQGDTVYNTKYIERIRFREKVIERIDTFTRDSIIVKDSVKIVERKITPKWCYYSLAICILSITFAIYKTTKLW